MTINKWRKEDKRNPRRRQYLQKFQTIKSLVDLMDSITGI